MSKEYNPAIGVRTSDPICVEEYEIAVIRRGTEPNLKLREIPEYEELDDLISELKTRTDKIQTAIEKLATPRESLTDAYLRVAGTLDTKFNHPFTYQPGVNFIDNALALCVAREKHSQYLAESFDKEYPNIYNPFREVNEMFKEGVWPKGFRVVKGHEVFVVDIPTVSRDGYGKGELRMSCWSQGEGEEQGKDWLGWIRYVHNIQDDCTYNLDSLLGMPRKVASSQDTLFLPEPPVLYFP